MNAMVSIQTPLFDAYRDVYYFGRYISSRFGKAKSVPNVFYSWETFSMPVFADIYYGKARNQNIEFQIRYIIQTIKGLDDSYLSPYSKIIRQNLRYGDLSYGEIIRKFNGKDWYKIDSNSRHNVLHLWDNITKKQFIPPCNLSVVFSVVDEVMHTLVCARSIDVLYGLGNDFIMFNYLHRYLARLNGFIPGKFSYAIANLHVYAEKIKRVKAILNDPIEANFKLKVLDALPDDFPNEIEEIFPKYEQYMEMKQC